MLVLHDDLEKKLGAVGMKKSGSANGHNGIRSVISATHSSDFKRMKIGIGRPNDRDMVSQYVLSDFTAAELEVIQTTVFPQVLKCLDLLFAPGPAPPVQTAT